MSILEEVTRILTQVKWPIFHLALEISWCCIMVNHGLANCEKISPCIWVEWQLTQPSLHTWNSSGTSAMTRKNWMTTDHSDDKKCRAVAPSLMRVTKWVNLPWIYVNTIKNSVSQIRSEVFPFLIHKWFFLVSSWWIIMYYGHPWPWTIMDHQLQYSFLLGMGLGGLGLIDYV